MFGLFKSKPLRDDFYEQNKLSAEWEPYLNIGALLIEGNQIRDALTLTSRLSAKQLAPLLHNAWNIHNAEETKALLEELLTLPVLKKQALISSEQLTNDALFDRINNNCGSIFAKTNLYFSKQYFDGIKDLAAWDIERAGLIARYAFNTGWLTKDEALNYLKALHKLAKQHYTNWLDYYLAYFKGRVILFDNSIDNALDYIFALGDFYKKEGYCCTAYPL
jgi:hypothetical protein